MYHLINTGYSPATCYLLSSLLQAKEAEIGEILEEIQRCWDIEVRQTLVIPPRSRQEKYEYLSFCLEYSKVNDVRKEGCFPLPRIGNSQVGLHS
jgi:hypothetical protein